MTVLVADDEAALLNILAFNIRRAGYTVLTAPDGDTAWRLISEHRPGAALLDAMMPGLTGPEVCRLVRATPELSHVKLRLVSAKGEEDLSSLASSCGADDCVSKPFSPSALLDRLAALLRA